MTVIFPNGGEHQVLDLVFDVNYTLRLYQNDVTDGLTPTEIAALDETDFTEATFTGYASAALTGGNWAFWHADPSVAEYAAQTFTSSTDQTLQAIYGYYVTRTSDGELTWFEPFGGALNIEFEDDFIEITPRVELSTGDDNVGVPVGGSIMWSGPEAGIPTGFLLRDGSAVSRSFYSTLFAVIGETYGVGDGSTTFNLPNSQQRFHMGVAASGTGDSLGDTGGSIDHVHDLDTSNSAANLRWPTSSAPVVMRRRTGLATTWDANLESGGNQTGTGNSDTGIASGIALTGDTDTANPPFIAEYFIIRAF